MVEFKYRPDIDGLRAVAVGLVLLFHAGLAFPGGFIGVDVFFVISGFIITSLLLKEQQNAGFRLSEFWIRRIRRILPASLFVVAATLIAGCFILLPADFVQLARSATAQQLMWSNVHFSRNTGYFDGNTDQMPLLHTWSLAVEEQFYVGYPFLLLFLARLSQKRRVASLVALAALSFLASAWGVHTDASAKFYLLPTRAWELLLGGLLCFAPRPTELNRYTAAALSVLGVAGIFAAACWYKSSTPFPGVSALLPCVATAALIYANSTATRTWVGRALSTRPVVYVGLISYSLYLWHWPLLSFLSYLNCGAQPSASSRVAALVLSFVLAAFSLKFIETPFRLKAVFPQTRGLLTATSAAVFVLLSSSTLIVLFQGLPQRFDPQVYIYASAKESRAFTVRVTAKQIREGTLPTFGAPTGTRKCLVWGDSHAMALIPGIDAACKKHDVKGFQATQTMTAPVLDFYYNDTSKGLGRLAPDFNQAVVDFAIAKQVDVVIIAGHWTKCAGYSGFEQDFCKTIEALVGAGIQVAIVRDVARFGGIPSFRDPVDVPTLLSMAARRGIEVRKIGIPAEEYAAQAGPGDAVMNRIAGMSPSVKILDPAPYFIDDNGLWRAEFEGVAMFRDFHHLTIEGGLRLAPLYESLFDKLELN